MKKFTIFTFGMIVVFSLLMFLFGMNKIISDSIMERRLIISDDYWWLLIPIILFSLIVYFLIKKPIIYNKHRNALSLFAIGLFLTLVVVFASPLSVVFMETSPLGYEIMMMQIFIAIVGLIISIILGFIGFLIDRKKT